MAKKNKTDTKKQDKPLTDKQKQFCKEYVIDFNGARAARDSGYSKKTANTIAAQNLAKENIQKEIQRLIGVKNKRAELSAEYVVNKIIETIDRCSEAEPVRDMFGNQIFIEHKSGEVTALFKYDAKNVLKGCELLGKHLAMFTENIATRLVDEDGDDREFIFRVVDAKARN